MRHRAKKIKNRKQSKWQCFRLNALCSLLLCSMLFALWGCATTKTSDVKESLEPKEVSMITGIDVQNYTVTITVNKPFIYTIYRPGDPYKIVVDLPDVSVELSIKRLFLIRRA